MDQYWHMTPILFEKYCSVRKRENENRVRENDSLNWILGKYISYAVNKPEKYPSKPYLTETVEPKVMTGEEMERRIKGLNKLFNGTVNATNRKS